MACQMFLNKNTFWTTKFAILRVLWVLRVSLANCSSAAAGNAVPPALHIYCLLCLPAVFGRPPKLLCIDMCSGHISA